MTVNYTTNLSLGQPVTGTESGTWGDDVNNAVTSYLDIAIAGGLAVTVTTTDVTLTITQGTSVATNIGSTTAQYAILNVSGAMTAARNLIVPSSSRIYLINNACTGGFLLTVKGSATSGVTLVNGEKAHVFWNGSDYAKLSNTQGGAGTFSSITNTGLTATRVVFSTSGGLETDSANLTFSGTILTSTGFAGPLNGTVGATTPAAGSFTSLTDSGNLTFTGTGNRITGDFTNGTIASRVAFQTSTTNGNTVIGLLTNGTGTSSSLQINNVSDTTTALSFGNFQVSSTEVTLQSAIRNSGTYLPMTFYTGGSERMRLDTSGNVGIGTSSPSTYANSYGPVLVTGTGNNFATIQGRTDGPSGATNGVAFGGSYSTNPINGSRMTLNAEGGGGQRGSVSFWTKVLDDNTTQPLERMRIDSSGNVGIGTASPTGFGNTNLNINSSGDTMIHMTNTTSGTASADGFDILMSGINAQFINREAGYLAMSTSATERMRIDSSGSALINQTASYTSAFGESPIFQVSQLRGTSPSIPAAFYCFGNDGIGARIALGKSRGTAIGTQTIVQNGDELGGVYFCGSDGTNMNQVAASITGISGGVPGATADMPGALLFNTTADGAGSPLERMRIDSSGIVTMSAYGAGAATFSAAGVISSVSDETWKIKDGVPVDPDSMLNKLEPGYWYYNDEKKEIFGVDRQLGFYAQNVNAAIGPEAAPTPEEGKPWGYYDRSVLAVTVMSLQKALATIESLTARITALEST